MNNKKILKIYTDGACKGNPGIGGWGVLIFKNKDKYILQGSNFNTTNNKMELQAAIEGLKVFCLNDFNQVEITTDSEYLFKGVTQWLKQWKNNNWKGSNKKQIKNVDLWKEIDKLIGNNTKIQWKLVRSHSGHIENEIADKLANEAIEKLKYLIK